MARGINKVTLIGHVGQDPEARYTPSGKCIVQLNLATGREWKNRDTGQKQTSTEWHRLVFFEPLSKVAGEYVKKGQHLYVEGFIRTREWKDRENQKRYTTEIVVQEMEMLGSKPASQSEATAANATNNDSAAPATATQSPAASTPPPENDFDGFDDDIPF